MTEVVSRHRCCVLLTCLVGLSACGDDDDDAGKKPVVDGSVPCLAGEQPMDDGSCLPSGVTAEHCAPGFEYDNANGCVAILPAAPCPPGQLALPGEIACREVAPCGGAPWGDAEIQPGARYVDAAFGGTSTGSEVAPYTTIQQGVNAAASGDQIIVAAGSYVETVSISNKSVELIARCPTMVEIVGDGAGPAAVTITQGASGTTLRNFAITGSGAGLAISGSEAVLLERLWIHDTAGRAIALEDTLGAAGAELRDSLIEGSNGYGLYLSSASVSVVSSVVRDLTVGTGTGLAVNAMPGMSAVRPSITITSSLFERSYGGVGVSGGDVDITALLVRDMLEHGGCGRGVEIQDHPTAGRGSLNLLDSVIERTIEGGVMLVGSDATVEGVTVRDTFLPAASGGRSVGLAAENRPNTNVRATLTATSSTFERSSGIGIIVIGSDAMLDRIIIRDTAPGSDGLFGRGLGVEEDPMTADRSNVTVMWSIIERNTEIGVFNGGSDMHLIGTAVRDTAAVPGLAVFGDGVSAVAPGAPATLIIEDCELSANERAAVAVFGAALSMTGTMIECNAIDIAGEDAYGKVATFEDGGQNICGCLGDERACKVLSSGLTAPEPLP